MTKIRQRKYLLAIVALVLVFAGCKGESPTAPTSPGGQGGGTTPPTGATVTLGVSNATPLVNSTTIVTATVTQNNQAVPNGTAVQFATSPLGTFTDANANNVIHTTTNGVATATLTSSSAGTTTITVVVNNVSAKTQVTFSAVPVTPPPPNTAPTITSISPATGKPAGGDIITITGTNFVSPVRAIFDFGSGVTKEAQVVSVTATQIQVISPPIDLGTGQTANATITIIVSAGTPNEQKVSASTTFTYQAAVLTPKITTLSPTSGPIDGGTRVTIFGEGFQAPVQVFFGSQEAQVINITFAQIIVMSPTARDTASNGSGTVTGPVDVKIININSNTSVTATGAFRYTPKMQITAMGPTEGPYSGGTRVTIDGVGFTDPVAVVIGGVAAMPIKVTGTQIIVMTSGVQPTSCADVTGPSSVTNVDNGDTATAPSFIYRVPKPVIAGVNPLSVAPGGTLSVIVANAQPGVNRFTVGGKTVFSSGATVNPDGSTTFTLVLPTSYTFATQSCAALNGIAGTGTQNVAIIADIVYTNAGTGCTDTAAGAVTITPPGGTACTPNPVSATITPSGATCASAGSIVAAGAVTGTTTITLTNAATSGANLTASALVSASSNATITVSPGSLTPVPPGGTATFTVTVDPTAAGAVTGTVTLSTNDPTKLSVPICITATGT